MKALCTDPCSPKRGANRNFGVLTTSSHNKARNFPSVNASSRYYDREGYRSTAAKLPLILSRNSRCISPHEALK